jgi:hypothetical protein
MFILSVLGFFFVGQLLTLHTILRFGIGTHVTTYMCILWWRNRGKNKKEMTEDEYNAWFRKNFKLNATGSQHSLTVSVTPLPPLDLPLDSIPVSANFASPRKEEKNTPRYKCPNLKKSIS